MAEEFLSYYKQLGGRKTLELVHTVLYDKIFFHPWLGKFFEGKDRKRQEDQQTEFMMHVLGGPKVYCGRLPQAAHCHMFITAEIFDLRHKYLLEALNEAKIPAELQERWISTDAGMRRALVKESPDQCKGRYNNDPTLNFPKPA